MICDSRHSLGRVNQLRAIERGARALHHYAAKPIFNYAYTRLTLDRSEARSHNQVGQDLKSLVHRGIRSMSFRGVLLSIALAAAGLVAPGQTAKPQQEPRYDPATIIDVLATVTDLREVPRGSPLAGVHLTVKTDKEAFDAYVAPADFLKEMAVSFVKGDRIQIVGSKVKFGDGPVVLVREVRKQNLTLYLRDQKGTPNWPSSEKGRT
jgi:hypothetical protein